MRAAIFDPGGNKQLINTGHRTFDDQTNALMVGNFHANTMHGGFIRAATDVSCNGATFEHGALRAHDLLWWPDKLPPFVFNEVIKATESESICLYEIFHHYQARSHGERRSRKLTHGYILSRYYDNHKRIGMYVTGYRYDESYKILYECALYLTNGTEYPYDALQAGDLGYTVEEGT